MGRVGKVTDGDSFITLSDRVGDGEVFVRGGFEGVKKRRSCDKFGEHRWEDVFCDFGLDSGLEGEDEGICG